MAKKDKTSQALRKSRKPSASQHLTEEERALWEYAARDLKPLKQKSHRVSTATREEASEAPRARETARHHPAHETPAKRAAAPAAKTVKAPPAVPPLSDLDRRKTRKIGAGRVDIEARIDLHGMRQSEAHVALRRFLMRAHADGKRWVLVITGKGTQARERPASELYGYGEPERGVLRRNVPHWLTEPELRSIVVGYTAAAIRHGGDGALYVQLRRRERTR